MNKLMDGYDIQKLSEKPRACIVYCVYQMVLSKIGKSYKMYRFGYPDYKSMIKKHPELK